MSGGGDVTLSQQLKDLVQSIVSHCRVQGMKGRKAVDKLLKRDWVLFDHEFNRL